MAADIFEAEFERGVLKNGVVAAVKGGRADVETLFVGDLLGCDEMIGVAGARGGDGGVEGVIEEIAERHARRGGFNGIDGRRALKHAGLCGHEKNLTQ